MRILFTFFVIILVAGFCYTQTDVILNENINNTPETIKALESTFQTLNEMTDEYAYFKTERSDSGYSSSYLFKYEDDLCKVITNTMTYYPRKTLVQSERIDRETGERYIVTSEKKETMIPGEMFEFEYIFDMREIDPVKTELVSWEDETGEYNQQISPAMGLTDPSQNYQLTYGHYRIKIHTIDDKNRILVRSDLQDSETNAVSLYFREKYYAEEFANKFNQAVVWKKETTR